MHRYTMYGNIVRPPCQGNECIGIGRLPHGPTPQPPSIKKYPYPHIPLRLM